ncbi:MAG: nucleotidyl transferase AbiEii/AbiGii toxin family protein [Patescibacteria group bacterium]|nr:nucleotidyl transferase AbiEii/AbiGii toxin family protein [Patescibacteria group bacterium]MBU1953320.1 nucleotidyl transferase AbiEii/AbiGii toxin family protein [Patescibacteria group bacterium]
MNNIVSNYNQILEFSRQYNIPMEKRRGIIREFLQSKFITTLYSLSKSEKMSFIGGTSLRLLRGINRFSEDLDFDNLGLTDGEVSALVEEVVRRFGVEGINVEVHSSVKEYKKYFDLRFPDLLKELEITSNPREKLMIKIDYAEFWKGQKNEVILFNKYGFVANVMTNPINQLIVQKLAAYLQRKQTQPRDIYDVVWLFSQGAKPDLEFAHANNLDNLIGKASEKLKVEGVPESFYHKLEPFLFSPEDTQKMKLFKKIVSSL